MAEYKNPLDNWMKELPTGAELSRRAWLEIKYIPAGETEEKDISEDVSKYLISMSYTDNLSDAADDVTITLEDRAQLWTEDWFPEGEGNMLDITIHTIVRLVFNDTEQRHKVFHTGNTQKPVNHVFAQHNG